MDTNSFIIKNIPADLEPSLLKYAKSFLGNVDPVEVSSPCLLSAEFIEWPDNPSSWGGPWADKYVLCTVKDYSLLTNIESEIVQEHKRKDWAKYSIYNLPYAQQKSLEREVTYQGSLCSRSAMTHQEYLAFEKSMTPLDLEAWQKKIQDSIATHKVEQAASPCIERPIRIHLAGNDDASYSLAVDTKEKAFEVRDMLKNEPRWATLKYLGFVFTN